MVGIVIIIVDPSYNNKYVNVRIILRYFRKTVLKYYSQQLLKQRAIQQKYVICLTDTLIDSNI